jgi:hypothetical protein
VFHVEGRARSDLMYTSEQMLIVRYGSERRTLELLVTSKRLVPWEVCTKPECTLEVVAAFPIWEDHDK